MTIITRWPPQSIFSQPRSLGLSSPHPSLALVDGGKETPGTRLGVFHVHPTPKITCQLLKTTMVCQFTHFRETHEDPHKIQSPWGGVPLISCLSPFLLVKSLTKRQKRWFPKLQDKQVQATLLWNTNRAQVYHEHRLECGKYKRCPLQHIQQGMRGISDRRIFRGAYSTSQGV